MAKLPIKQQIKNYYKKKKWYSIVSDFAFVILIILLIIPTTRTDVASFFIRLTSLPPSTLQVENQYKISNDAENWTITTIDGKKIEFKELNDKPVFVNLWATWCPPCIAELPGIIDLYENYKDDVNFVLASNENPQKLKEYIKKKGYPENVFFINSTLPGDFYSKSIPATFIIDNNGHVVLSKKGAARWNSGKVENILDELINNK